MPQSHPLIVIGAGAAGMLAAWRAAVCGAPVLLLERNPRPGIKLLISGGGKCNITHAGSMDELRSAFIPREARFLKPAFHRFGARDIVRMLEEEGVATFTRPDNRIFPVSGRASDVVDALIVCLERAGVTMKLNLRVEAVHAEDGRITAITAGGATRPTAWVVLATGGVSYPKTGTTGDGLAWARQLRHTIVPLRAALAPITVRPSLPVLWRGVAIRGGALSVYAGGRKREEFHGDILFTHEGISGPAALEVSRTAALALENGGAELRLDCFPGLEFTTLEARLMDAVRQHRDRRIVTHLEAWLPNRIVPFLLDLAGIEQERRGHTLTRDDRRALVHLLKSWSLGAVASVPLERGEVTAGGIALHEVDPKTMRSRRVKGLYLCGEMLDIAGPVGGYNLQAAFSTGAVAGETAASDWLLEHGNNSSP